MHTGRLSISTLVIALLTATACCTVHAEEEWSRFRGPNGQGQSEATTIPTTWTEADYNWKIELPGIGHASPVIWGNKVFVTSADPETALQHLLCIDATTGKKLWQRDFPSATYHVHQQNNFASSTPALDDKRIYFAFASVDEFALLALTHNGEDVWRINLGTFKTEHGFGTSPIVVGDQVIITNDQEGDVRFVISVDSATGNQRWKILRDKADNRQNASYSTPCVMDTPQGPELITCSWAHGISGHDLNTGAMNWEAPVFKLRPVASPVLVDGLILCSCGEGGGNNTMVAVRPGNKEGRKPMLAYPPIDRSTAPYVPTICTYGDLAFLWGEKGILACIDAPTGKVHYRQRVGGNFYGSPIRVQDRIYCMSTDGEVAVVAASPEYKLLARNPLGEGTQATPAVSGGKMYLRTASHLVSIGGKSAEK